MDTDKKLDHLNREVAAIKEALGIALQANLWLTGGVARLRGEPVPEEEDGDGPRSSEAIYGRFVDAQDARDQYGWGTKESRASGGRP